MYEEVSDAAAAGTDIADIIGTTILTIAALIAAPISLAAAAIISIVSIAFREFVEVATYVGADVWDSTFNDLFKCMLYECSDVDEGVVTFDWDCLVQKLYDYTGETITPDSIRLLAQLGYLLNIISIDGLNLAGATTAITDGDCSDCEETWCYTFYFTDGWNDFEPLVNGYGTYGTQTIDGIRSTFFPSPTFENVQAINMTRDFGGIDITGMTVRVNAPFGSGATAVVYFNHNGGNIYLNPMSSGELDYGYFTSFSLEEITLGTSDPNRGSGDYNYIVSLMLTGFGANPFGEDNC